MSDFGDRRVVLDAYMEEFNPSREHLVSFNALIEEGLSGIVEHKGGFVVPLCHKSGREDVCSGWYYVLPQNPRVCKPTFESTGEEMWPMDARRHGKAYSGDILVDVVVKHLVLKSPLSRVFEKTDANATLKHFRAALSGVRSCDVLWPPKVTVEYGAKMGRLPVMLHSICCRLNGVSKDEIIRREECPRDTGGYFIGDKGKEKVVVSRDRLARNRVKVLWNKKTSVFRAEIQSSQRLGGYITMTCMSVSPQTSHLLVELPCNRSKPGAESAYVPLYTLVALLGMGSYEDVSSMIAGSMFENDDKRRYQLEELIECNRECYPESLERAQEILSKYIEGNRQHAIDFFEERSGGEQDRNKTSAHETAEKMFLSQELLPHMGSGNLAKKGVYLCRIMARKLLAVHFGASEPTDRDCFSNKGVDLSGYLMETLFRNVYGKLYINPLKKGILKTRSVLGGLREAQSALTMPIKKAMRKGDWSVKRYGAGRGRAADKKGSGDPAEMAVSQQLSRMSKVATMAYLRKLETPVSKNSAGEKIRALHPSHKGRLAPEDTPEGGSLGLVKGFALGARVSMHTDSQHVAREVLATLRKFRGGVVLYLEEEDPQEYTREEKDFVRDGICVCVNGSPVAVCAPEMGSAVTRALRKMRRLCFAEVSVIWDEDDKLLDLLSDEGRLMRPLIPVKNGVPVIDPRVAITETFTQLLRSGKVVYMACVEEQQQHVVADLPEDIERFPGIHYTMLVVHPSLMTGIASSLTPFPERNPAPRNTYQSGMAKQAMGVYSLNYRQLGTNNTYVLTYPQKPLVATKQAKYLGMVDETPNGINVVVDILSWTGYNMEDAIIVNKSAVDRGLFMAWSYKKYAVQEDRSEESYDKRVYRVCKPNYKETGKRRGVYAHLDENGIVPLGTYVHSEMILVGVVYLENQGSKCVTKDCSVSLGLWETGYVDLVSVTTDSEGMKVVQVTIRKMRVPECGDKFTFMCAQKSVCAVLMSQEDLPWDPVTGEVPDIVFNCCSLSSRMTVGLMLQTILGLSAAGQGRFHDATAFEWRGERIKPVLEQAEAFLRSRGLVYGKSRKRNPFTGELIEGLVYRGLAYYTRLPHLVSNKFHARATGKVCAITRQPVEGRTRNGGLRFGEMERDAALAWGAAHVLQDRMRTCSDEVGVTLCPGCKKIIPGISGGCRVCSSMGEDNPRSAKTCFAFAQLGNELQALGVGMNIHTTL